MGHTIQAYRQQDNLVAIHLTSSNWRIDGVDYALHQAKEIERIFLFDEGNLPTLEENRYINGGYVWEPYSIQINGAYIVEHAYIKPFRKLGMDVGNTRYYYAYSQHVISLMVKLLEDEGYTKAQNFVTFPASDTKFIVPAVLKIKDMMIKIPSEKPQYPESITRAMPVLNELQHDNAETVLNGTFEELEAVFKRNVDLCQKAVKSLRATHDSVKKVLGEVQYGKLLAELYDIRNSVYSLDIKIKSQRDKTVLSKKIGDLIENLTDRGSKK